MSDEATRFMDRAGNPLHASGSLVVKRNSDPEQWTIANKEIDRRADFKAVYFNVTGYFGTHGPHMLAAAPELLEALEGLLEISERLCDPIWHDSKAVLTARAVIAKAKGDSL